MTEKRTLTPDETYNRLNDAGRITAESSGAESSSDEQKRYFIEKTLGLDYDTWEDFFVGYEENLGGVQAHVASHFMAGVGFGVALAGMRTMDEDEDEG